MHPFGRNKKIKVKKITVFFNPHIIVVKTACKLNIKIATTPLQ